MLQFDLKKLLHFVITLILCLVIIFLIPNGLLAKSCPNKIEKPEGCKSLSYRPKDFCKRMKKKWVPDGHNEGILIRCNSEMHIDHIISWKWAYDTGKICDPKKLDALCRDPNNLIFTKKKTNLMKSDLGPVEWNKKQQVSPRQKGFFVHLFLNASKGYLNITEQELLSGVSDDPQMAKKIIQETKPTAELIRAHTTIKYETGMKIKSTKSGLNRLTLSSLGAVSDATYVLRRNLLEKIPKKLARKSWSATPAGVAALSVPGVASATMLGFLAWEIHEDCQLIKEITRLNKEVKKLETLLEIGETEIANSEESNLSTENDFCGMTKDALFQTITGVTLDFEKCMNARMNSYEINPDECKNFEIDNPDYDIIINKEISLEEIENPNYD